MIGHNMVNRRHALSLLGCTGLLQPLRSVAQPEWPAGAAIKIVTPTPAGVGTDLFARAYAEHLSKDLNIVIVVENRLGASDMLGADVVAKSPLNGLTLLISVSRPFTTPAELLPKMPTNPAKSLVPITQPYHSGSFIIAGSTFPGNSLKDLIALAKQRPGFNMIPTWVGLWAPGSTPAPIVKRLQGAIAAVNKDPVMLKILADAGAEPKSATQAQMVSAIARELEMTTRLVKAKNITLD